MMSLTTIQLSSARRIVTMALALLLIPHLWFVRTDLSLYAGDWPNLRDRLAVRAFMVAISVSGIILVRQSRRTETYQRVVFMVAMALVLSVLGLNAMRPQGSVLPLRTPLMILIVLYGAMPNEFWRQAVPPLVLSAGLAILRLTWVTSGAQGDIGGDLIVLGIINAVGITMLRRRGGLVSDLHTAWEAEHAARLAAERATAELRTLRGIIPICAHCKNVRTTKGDWERIEAYVRGLTDAEFSHGICPDCLVKHYDLPASPAGPAAKP